MSEKAFIETFGCQMNEHDSFRMMEVLLKCGYERATSLDEAALVVLNTCSVREKPEHKVFSLLGRLTRLKKAKPGLIIAVGGCVAQQEGEAILRREKSVDLVFGPDYYFRLPEMIGRVRKGERVLMTRPEDEPPPERVENFIPEEWVESGHLDGCKAYVAIMKGCDNFCSFCVVPNARGREVSREPENILREVRSLIGKGAKEIWLLGQNVNSFCAAGWGFYELLDAVSQVKGVKRVRFTSPHPKDWSNRLADLVADRPTICNQVHLPFQAGSDRILELMNRRHTMKQYLDKVGYIRSVLPNVEISTDLIVGFPTETEADFLETLRVLEEARFGLVYSFKYSPRPATRAAQMEDDVPRDVKEDRLARVIEVQDRINLEQMEKYMGTEHELLIDNVHPRERGIVNGRTEGYRPVSVCAPELEIGDLATVRITGRRNHWLKGELV